MVYALWFDDPEKRTTFKRFLRVTDETLISYYRDCHIFLTADQIEKHIIRTRELAFITEVLNNPNKEFKILKFNDYAKCS